MSDPPGPGLVRGRTVGKGRDIRIERGEGRKMNRAIVSLFLALLMVLAWNGSGESAAPVTVRVWTFLKPSGMTGRERALKQIITDFEAANPGIKVQVEPIPYQELPRQFAAAISAKNAPDIVWLEAVDSELLRHSSCQVLFSPL